MTDAPRGERQSEDQGKLLDGLAQPKLFQFTGRTTTVREKRTLLEKT